jgi:hypothetical protein
VFCLHETFDPSTHTALDPGTTLITQTYNWTKRLRPSIHVILSSNHVLSVAMLPGSIGRDFAAGNLISVIMEASCGYTRYDAQVKAVYHLLVSVSSMYHLHVSVSLLMHTWVAMSRLCVMSGHSSYLLSL